ncbi:phage holin family protein [Microbacterium trichothecenolyticum]|uniref:phage holin family protein n=1 Tax=Microbacterium trichothecenolyticum TaxID=69370 RepID=UPI001C6DF528|nr:phage holin family protein [Microbacterium trichothecenolyticum]MBW9119287.1 phage holin family protein [Microbacterium trichothecenolyticum]
MLTLLIRALIFLVSAALGLIVADLILEGFYLHWNDWWGIVLAVVIFAVLQSVLAPWLLKITRRHANALIGGIGLLSTFVALLIAVLIPAAGIGIDGPVAWIIGTLIVWLVTALATWLLPPLFIKNKVQDRRG